jgi:D-arabinose 1-dehydrogenase-like Zn-dependent alcohol dehydrogenase
MKAVQVPAPGGELQVVERDIPTPGPGDVRIRVLACGVCHSDVVTKNGLLPGISYPRVPGHEIAGVVDAAGADVSDWKAGDRVGVGWHGGHDGTCPACRRGAFLDCVRVTNCGVHFDGGYQEFMIAPVSALARLPDTLEPAFAAPLMCAGNTTFSALRMSGASGGDLVAVQGIGGLGHLAVQFAHKLAFRVAAVGRGPGNAELAKKLGADVYVDSVSTDAARELQRLGGARAILATAPSGKAMASLIGGLAPNGTLVVIGASAEPIDVTPNALLFERKKIHGWLAGPPADTEDTLRFAERTGVRPMIETYPLAEASEAYARMLSGKAEFRVVLTT